MGFKMRRGRALRRQKDDGLTVALTTGEAALAR